jgi:hypothetical protein
VNGERRGKRVGVGAGWRIGEAGERGMSVFLWTIY